MGVRELRDAFNEVLGAAGSCVKAFMDYKRVGAEQTEYQILFFSGNYADGAGFVIQSELIPPNGDLIAASQATAQALLKQRGTQ